jgi:hypothetical protein
VTGKDGISRLQAAAFGQFGIQIHATAPGYLTEQKYYTNSEIENIAPAHLFEAADRRPPALVVEMFAEPAFTVELIVPDGYHGLVKAQIHIQDDAAPPQGQRCFRYEVSRLGEVQVTGPALLRRAAPADYQARFRDGKLLGEQMTATTVGVRWLKTEDYDQYYVVGTQIEYDALRRRMLDEDTPAPSTPKKSQGGGHSGRHQRGG